MDLGVFIMRHLRRDHLLKVATVIASTVSSRRDDFMIFTPCATCSQVHLRGNPSAVALPWKSIYDAASQKPIFAVLVSQTGRIMLSTLLSAAILVQTNKTRIVADS
jgi:hypothetical protein